MYCKNSMKEQNWLEITLIAHNESESERLEQALIDAGAIAITYTAADNSELFEPPIGEMPLWATTGVTGLFTQGTNPENVQATLTAELNNEYNITHKLFADSQWTRAWLDYFQPIQFGTNFWVAASEHIIEDPDAIVLRLDPGLAFGTGTHPSTAMCLNYLVNHANVTDKSVYDYGCGSGILGIAAALAGAKEVWQTDIDPQALIASADNAEKNNVRERIHLCKNPEQAPKVDLLIANILLEPLCALRPQFEQHLKPSTRLYFAGLLERQQNDIEIHYSDGYHIQRVDEREGWILLELTPKNL